MCVPGCEIKCSSYGWQSTIWRTLIHSKCLSVKGLLWFSWGHKSATGIHSHTGKMAPSTSVQWTLTGTQWFTRRRQWHPTPVLLPGKSHGQRSLVGCSPWGLEKSDMTERLHFHFSLSCIGEGDGNPLQRSCLENPRDGGAWWAAVYGVAQSWTRLKWRSSLAAIY